MRIGIDVRKINDFGIGTYIQNLVKHLLELDKQNQYFLFFHHRDIENFSYPKEQVVKLVNNSPKYSIREHFSLSHQAKKYDIQLFHEPHYTLPYFLECKKVVSIHDLIHLKFPQNLPAKKAYIYDKYILYSGSVRKHKNLENALKAYAMLKDKSYDLVLAGVGLQNQKVLEPMLKELKITEKVKIIPFLDYAELALLYNSAAVLFFPTLYEGFGLPVLEAMACGIPVVSSNNSSIAEVSGDAAVLVYPANLKEMAEALGKVLAETSLRKRMISLGLERAKIFTWKKTAEKTLRIYQELLEN